MIPTIINTLETTDYETMLLFDRYIDKLDIYGVSDGKLLMYKRILEELLRDDNVIDEDKLKLNLILIKLKKTIKII